MMCSISSQLGEHRLRTKYNDIEKANLAYRKQRRHTHKQTRKMIMNQGYSGNNNRVFCKDNNIETSFTQKGKAGTNKVKNATKRELARVRATAMEGSFGTQKEHYGLRKIAARIKSTGIMLIFFGIHTANAVNLAKRESIQLPLAA